MGEEIIAAARRVRAHAYAPYSGYSVGAAVMGENGVFYTGCNVENASYGLTICAERAAVFAMVADGCTALTQCALVTKDGGVPCGACLQVLSEFVKKPSECQIHCEDEAGNSKQYFLSELIPHAFGS